MWQVYPMAAGGSRERFDVWQFYRLCLLGSKEMNTLGKNTRWAVRGSRLSTPESFGGFHISQSHTR